LSGRSHAPAVAKPHRRQPPKACPLALAQRGQRVLIGANTAAVLTDPTGLDLGEDERAPVEGDQVDLTVARANVAPHDAKADPPQVRRRQLLAESTQRSPRVTGRSGEVLRRGGPLSGQGAITLQIAWEAALTCPAGGPRRAVRHETPGRDPTAVSRSSEILLANCGLFRLANLHKPRITR